MFNWEELENYCLNCRRCKLSGGRTHVVVGDGNKEADIMFIGEGPGKQEDLQGLPFVGPAGQLFDKMLASIGLDRSKVYICNVVKCRPPYNRDPEEDEKTACLPLLRTQVALVKPKIIVCLGRISGQVVMRSDFRITREHGVWEERKGYWLSATYHPAALLRDPAKKRESWEDLKKLKAKIEELGIFAAADGLGADAAVEARETAEFQSADDFQVQQRDLVDDDAAAAEDLPWASASPAEDFSEYPDVDFSLDADWQEPVRTVESDEIPGSEDDLNLLGF
ncbi:MAG: uracil-DNA glycosylase [Bacillota bacterium]|jgi:uracil-DNA glycosylase family 4